MLYNPYRINIEQNIQYAIYHFTTRTFLIIMFLIYVINRYVCRLGKLVTCIEIVDSVMDYIWIEWTIDFKYF